MSKFIYTEEMVEYLGVVAVGKHRDDITKAFNSKFGTRKTTHQIASAMKARGIVSGYPHCGRLRIFTHSELDWIKEQYSLRPVSLFYDDFITKFGGVQTKTQVKSAITSHGFKCDREGGFKKGVPSHLKGKKGYNVGGRNKETQFKKGKRCYNALPVGHERICQSGYTSVKVGQPSVWRQKHIVVWEQHNGPLPAGGRVSFRDNDRSNFDPSNLMMITSGELGVMNAHKLNKVEPELKDAALMLAQLIIKRGTL